MFLSKNGNQENELSEVVGLYSSRLDDLKEVLITVLQEEKLKCSQLTFLMLRYTTKEEKFKELKECEDTIEPTKELATNIELVSFQEK